MDDVENGAEVEVVQAPEASGEESETAQINRLLDEGYSGKQLVEKFDFKYSTVRREIKRRERPEDAPVVEVRELPATLKSTDQRSAMVERGRKRAETFSWNSYVASLLDVFRELS